MHQFSKTHAENLCSLNLTQTLMLPVNISYCTNFKIADIMSCVKQVCLVPLLPVGRLFGDQSLSLSRHAVARRVCFFRNISSPFAGGPLTLTDVLRDVTTAATKRQKLICLYKNNKKQQQQQTCLKAHIRSSYTIHTPPWLSHHQMFPLQHKQTWQFI